jgi:hypothetical protein
VINQPGLSYQWNLAKIDYSTDILPRRKVELRPVFAVLVRTAIHAVRHP